MSQRVPLPQKTARDCQLQVLFMPSSRGAIETDNNRHFRQVREDRPSKANSQLCDVDYLSHVMSLPFRLRRATYW